LSPSDADKLALAVVNYTGAGSQAAGGNNSFMRLDDSVLKPKNRPYDNLLELMEVNGMTQDIFGKLKMM